MSRACSSLAYEPVLMPPEEASAFLRAAAAFIDLVRSQSDEFVMQLLAYAVPSGEALVRNVSASQSSSA